MNEWALLFVPLILGCVGLMLLLAAWGDARA